ncbi:MAG: S49 family peptidase [Candidatus Obscuribacterales bacterium]|nr:S49 family peptidase [Candidatus Obscuribacterales bacterium]
MNHSEKKALEFVHKHRRKFYAVGILILFFAMSIASEAVYDSFKPDAVASEYSESEDTSSCNVLGINLHGDLYTYVPESNDDELMSNKDVVGSEEIMGLLETAEDDENIKAVIVEVDSLGGYPVAGEEVANAIKASSKPVVAFIRQSGTSAAYWAISTADQVFASKNSDVGSIGVTTSYLENVGKNEKEGLKYVQLSAGKYKDAGSPDKPLTDEEKTLIIRDLKIIHENFIQDVATNRNIPIEKVRAIADGSSILGERAKELGLIDGIGGYAEVKNYIEEKIGEKPEVCW